MQRFYKILQNGIFCMLASALFFSVMGAFVKFSLREIPVMEVVFFRSIISALILGVLIWKNKESFLGRRPWLLLGRGLAGFAAIVTNFYAVSKIPLGDAAMLNQTAPIWVAVFAIIFLKETLPLQVLLLSLLSLIGVAFIVKPSFSYTSLAALAGLSSGVMAALAFVAIRELHASDSFYTMAFYFTGITSLFSAPFVLTDFALPRIPIFWCLIGVGLSGTLGQLLMTYAYKNEQASIVAPFSYLSVLLSFLFGILFFGEIPDLYSGLGSAIVIASCIALLQIRKMKYVEIEE